MDFTDVPTPRLVAVAHALDLLLERMDDYSPEIVREAAETRNNVLDVLFFRAQTGEEKLEGVFDG